MDEVTLEAKLEALLFLYGEPVKLKKLAEVLGVKGGELEDTINSLSLKLDASDRGLHLVKSDERLQLTTKSSLSLLLSTIAQEELDSGLTPASMETLSIIAYLGPCKRSLVEHIRGVNSSFILRSLLIRGLLLRKHDPNRTSTFVYQVSFDFLRHMGVGHVSELPEYEKYRDFESLFENSLETSGVEELAIDGVINNNEEV